MLRRVLLSPSSSRLLGTPSSWGRLQQPVLRQTCKRSLSSAASDDGAVVVAEDMKALEDGVASVPKAVVYYTASWCPPVSVEGPRRREAAGLYNDGAGAELGWVVSCGGSAEPSSPCTPPSGEREGGRDRSLTELGLRLGAAWWWLAAPSTLG